MKYVCSKLVTKALNVEVTSMSRPLEWLNYSEELYFVGKMGWGDNKMLFISVLRVRGYTVLTC